MRARAVALAGLVVLLASAADLQRVPHSAPEPSPNVAAKAGERPHDPATVDSPAPVGAAAFTIHLEPEFALENGPVVFRITLTNRTNEVRECWRHTDESPVRFRRFPDWPTKPSPDEEEWTRVIIGQPGPYHQAVPPGKTTTELIAVQGDYQRIPPGRVSVEFEWDVVGSETAGWDADRRSRGHSVSREREGTQEPVRGQRTFEILPATPENIARVKDNLEEYLREAVGGTRPVREVVQCLAGSRHPEFVPLMMRAAQLCENCDCEEMLTTLYDCFPNPATGFERLFPLLQAGDPASRHVLDYWHSEDFWYVVHQRIVERVKPGEEADWNVKTHLKYWNYSRVHPNNRMTLAQHARVQAVENVWVRAAYWQQFPGLCSPEWTLCLFADLKRTTLPLDEKAVQAVCRGLANDRFAVRERATADAMKMDERVILPLRDYLKQHPSAESKQRVSLIARHFAQQPVPPLADYVIQFAMRRGEFQGELIFEALSGPPGMCHLADYVRQKKPEQQRRRQEQLERNRELERLRLAQ